MNKILKIAQKYENKKNSPQDNIPVSPQQIIIEPVSPNESVTEPESPIQSENRSVSESESEAFLPQPDSPQTPVTASQTTMEPPKRTEEPKRYTLRSTTRHCHMRKK